MYFPVGAAFGLLVIIVTIGYLFGDSESARRARVFLAFVAGFLLLFAFFLGASYVVDLIFDIP
jgi:uncharacterized membrane protein